MADETIQEAPERVPDPLFAKLLEASKDANAVAKQGENTDQKYHYAKAEDVIKEARRALHGAGLVAVIDFEVVAMAPIKSRSGTQGMFCRVEGVLRIADPETSLATTVKGAGAGLDYPGDKSPYKAMTGCSKYLYAMALGIPFGDDPEADTPPPAASGPPRGFTDAAQRKAFEDALRQATVPVDEAAIVSIMNAVDRQLTPAQIDNAGRQLMNPEHAQRAVASLRKLAGMPPHDPTEPDTRDLPDADPEPETVDAELVSEPEPESDPLFPDDEKDDPKL